MQIFLYEHLSGGGMLQADLSEPDHAAMLREGTAMFAALAADLLRIEGAGVVASRDPRLTDSLPQGVVTYPVASPGEERALFRELAAAADGTLIIAPECDGALLERCCWAESAGARLLSPAASLVAVAGDKQATAAVLAAAGVPIPPGVEIRAGETLPLDFTWPGVLKPRDGAGSMDTRHLADRSAAREVPSIRRAMRLERFCHGLPASVAILCGPGRLEALPAAWQHISSDGNYRYVGGSLPLPPALCRRAQRLARRAIAALPPVIGYVGVDLILGDPADGSGDVVLEVNPRLTTSYTGLRRLCRGNLAEAMLRTAQGEPVELSWRKSWIEFDAGGRVTAKPRNGS